MAFILGAVGAIFILSKLVGFLLLRKFDQPKKQFLSIPIAWVLAVVIAGYGMSDGGPPRLDFAAINYGIASIILLCIYATKHAITSSSKGTE